MHAALRSLSSPDLGHEELETYEPTLADEFGVLLLAQIGPDTELGEEAFYLTVCTPKWLARSILSGSHKGFQFVHHHLAVERWDPLLFRRAIADLCHRAEADSWPGVANKLSSYLAWEFGDSQHE